MTEILIVTWWCLVSWGKVGGGGVVANESGNVGLNNPTNTLLNYSNKQLT